jgi:SAM-dependent methyltransferase
MSVFGSYAEWYDLFYEDKDYRAEAAFVARTLAAHGNGGRELLEIGSGTGAHAEPLVEAGFHVLGIDRSERMLARARARLAGAQGSASFQLGDARSFDLGHKLDGAISLFHVMSYQSGPGELDAVMRCVRRHLRPGGLFLFDFWYGPAVLAQRPERRQRVVENDRYRVIRTAMPTLHPDRHVVDVAYHFDVLDKSTDGHQQLDEIHPMRYFAGADLERSAAAADFTTLALRGWMTERPPDETTWAAFAVLRATE